MICIQKVPGLKPYLQDRKDHRGKRSFYSKYFPNQFNISSFLMVEVSLNFLIWGEATLLYDFY